MSTVHTVLVTGGAGYVGSALVPTLLSLGYGVRVLDLYTYGEDLFDAYKRSPRLEQIRGDIRDGAAVRKAVRGCDAVIHLACISNDPSFELDPELGKSINYDCFPQLVRLSKEAGVRRFVYASTSSVYGISDAPEVREDHALQPLTDYSKYKALCEPILLEQQSADFVPVIIRPATVCGYAPRQRLDLVVNILTNHAVNNHRINVLGGTQTRPNIHISDMVRLYATMLGLPDEPVAGQVFNVGGDNLTVSDIEEVVRTVVQTEMPGHPKVDIVTTPTNDPRSYRINSDKIAKRLGFLPNLTVQDAVVDLVRAFRDGLLPDPMTDIRYFNVKMVQTVKLS
ncbi:MAG: NAD-dependent epimerase/dehydratase family protein [Chloroflexi bacterium]|nr:NAD-dependent epimerase/dehydratase family protein [Chloroflexota bacterium]